MARSDAVWGIDIGQCALKALRGRPHDDPNRITADAFDYIEYPKILSQPDVDPVELVREALKQFLSRNSVRGDRVVISVSGQSGLARFIKLPPVESKKIPDIVKYEARQQIPFALDDVVWDYQQMVGGSVVEGFAMETEVGLFAMKRDQVVRALKPFSEAGIEVDIIQLTPLALFNFAAFDQMRDLPPPDEYDPDNPPESLVLLSLGTDTTDLVVTNGFRVWQRSIPIGGNHFTKALTKDLKLTFATAEHLKRNASQADDPKALFQAMRPVFNDLLTEVQRSIGYFTNLDRRAKIGRGLAMGNAMKLPGLQRYLAQNLGFDLGRLESFRGLSGTAVIDAPAFKENVLAFGVSYGLALQGLRDTKIKTNLLPREIAKDRLIRGKKPWAIGAAAALLLGLTVSYVSHVRAAQSVSLDDSYFKPAVDEANRVVTTAKEYETEYEGSKQQFSKTGLIGTGLILNVANRDVWLRIIKAINLCLPQVNPGNPPERPDDLTQRHEVVINSVECWRVERLEEWYAGVKDRDVVARAPAAPEPAAPNAADGGAPAAEGAAQPAADAQPAAEASTGPTGPGWIFELTGHHFHNQEVDIENQGAQYLRNTLLRNLRQKRIAIPPDQRRPGESPTFPVGEFGIGYAVLIDDSRINWRYVLSVDDPDTEQERAQPGAAAGKKKEIPAPRYDFVVQFCWKEPAIENPALVADGQPAAADGQAAPPAPAADADQPAEASAQPGEASAQPGEGGAEPAEADGVPADPAPAAEDDVGEQPADSVEPGPSEPSGDPDEPANAGEQADPAQPN
ncbi:MAG: type IV pilus assembly protein PilM [Pirellulales bacterium]